MSLMHSIVVQDQMTQLLKFRQPRQILQAVVAQIQYFYMISMALN